MGCSYLWIIMCVRHSHDFGSSMSIWIYTTGVIVNSNTHALCCSNHHFPSDGDQVLRSNDSTVVFGFKLCETVLLSWCECKQSGFRYVLVFIVQPVVTAAKMFLIVLFSSVFLKSIVSRNTAIEQTNFGRKLTCEVVGACISALCQSYTTCTATWWLHMRRNTDVFLHSSRDIYPILQN